MKENQIFVVVGTILLLVFGWLLGLKTEVYLIEKGIHQLKNGKVEYVCDTVNTVGDEYLQDSCYDSTLKHINIKKYNSEIGG